MANYPYSFTGKETLQPGARGEIFQSDIPGYRNQGDRVNRTNFTLGTCEHDVPNIKYELDRRLPVLFRFGYAHGYNQITLPKGRVVAIDKNLNQVDFDTKKAYNVLTLATGGNVVKLAADKKTWEAVTDPTEVAKVTVDTVTGKAKYDGVVTDEYRLANTPVGVIQRNEYTRNDDAFNGIQPGAILTDKLVELPLFADEAKAKGNPWGSAYGAILPGDLVKSDANGRIIPSPLNSEAAMTAAGLDTAAKIELERQQVIGKVLEVTRDLVPAGAARFAQWALEDRMNFDQFNPAVWRGNYRDGEDINEKSPYRVHGGGNYNVNKSMTGVDPFSNPGYPYDSTMSEHDLHMLASTARKSENRYGLEYQMENGIPGLTDGYNAYSKAYDPTRIKTIDGKASNLDAYVDMYMKLPEVNVEAGSVKIAVTDKDYSELSDGDFTSVTVAGQTLTVTANANTSAAVLKVNYIDEKQGFIVIGYEDKTAYDTFLGTNMVKPIHVYAKFSKRGLSGVPTFLDWDGCEGKVSVLLQM